MQKQSFHISKYYTTWLQCIINFVQQINNRVLIVIIIISSPFSCHLVTTLVWWPHHLDLFILILIITQYSVTCEFYPKGIIYNMIPLCFVFHYCWALLLRLWGCQCSCTGNSAPAVDHLVPAAPWRSAPSTASSAPSCSVGIPCQLSAARSLASTHLPWRRRSCHWSRWILRLGWMAPRRRAWTVVLGRDLSPCTSAHPTASAPNPNTRQQQRN